MHSYVYKAYIDSGRTETGIVKASNPTHASRLLAQQNKQVYKLTPSNEGGSPEHLKSNRFLFEKPVDTQRLFEDLAELMSAGLNADTALQTMLATEASKSQKQFYTSLLDAITEGHALSSAFAKNSVQLPGDIIALTQAGEKSGKLAIVMKLLAEDANRTQTRKRKLFEALLYPAFLLLVIIGAIAVISGVLIPALEPVFASSNQPAPFVISLFAALRLGFVEYWSYFLGFTLALITLCFLPSIRSGILKILNKTIPSVPLIGAVLKKLTLARYLQSLSLLLGNNVTLQESLALSAECCKIQSMAKQLMTMNEEVLAGTTLPAAMENTGLFSPEIISIINVGDRVNKLPDVLARASGLLDKWSQNSINRFLAFLSPAITILMGGVIGMLAVSIMSALLSINELAL